MKAKSYAWIEAEDKLPSWRVRELDIVNEGRHGSVTISDDAERVFAMVAEEEPRIGHGGGLEIQLAGWWEEGEDPLALATATVVRKDGDRTEIKIEFWGGRVKPITISWDPHRRRAGNPEETAGPTIHYGYELVEAGE